MFNQFVTPIASATPDPNDKGRVSRRFRWIPKQKLEQIEAMENAHRDRIANEAVIIRREFNPTRVAETIGFRKDARLRDGDEQMRRKRGPGFRRNQRLKARLDRLNNRLLDLTSREFKEWLDLRDLQF